MNQPATRIDTATLDPLETASVDELRATQVKRLKWSLKYAYDNVPSTATPSTRLGRIPTISRRWRISPNYLLPPRPICATTTRSACWPRR